MKMNEIIKIEGLNKSFGEVKAVQNLSFEVRKGELFAFLGVNGAGKSTTISIICGRLEKDSGSVFVDGKNIDSDIDSIKSVLGVVFQNSVLDVQLSVIDNLENRAALYGIHGKEFKERIAMLSEILELEPLLKRPLGKLSGGQKRKIDIARALIHNPKILILDEPTTGLDPQTRKTIWDVIQKFRKDFGMTVFLTTHYMEEAAICDNVIILDSGKISAAGTPYELKTRYTGDFITLYGVTEDEVKKLSMPFEAQNESFKITVPSTSAATELICKYPEIFRDYEITKGDMDDVFLAVTGKKLGGSEK